MRANRSEGRQPEVEVQDNRREAKMRELFRLRDSGQGRGGADALDDEGNEFELKSTTRGSVSTARDVGPHTIRKWRQRYWLFAKGKNFASGYQILETFFLHPGEMEDWFGSLETKFAKDNALLERALAAFQSAGATPDDVNRLRYLAERGLTVNNPHVPWRYIVKHGHPISNQHRKIVQELVRRFPLG